MGRSGVCYPLGRERSCSPSADGAAGRAALETFFGEPLPITMRNGDLGNVRGRGSAAIAAARDAVLFNRELFALDDEGMHP